MTTITIEHVTKSFVRDDDPDQQQILAVDNISLKIHDGEVFMLLGPSGCGKSTLLRVIAGLTQPDSGQVLYDNEALREIPARERGIGMVFQDGALMPHWEAGRSVGFFLWLRRREHEIPERMHRISQITGVGLDHLLARRPAHLSGGEKQRVAIARALARDPRVFLFDEPFSNLDARFRGQARVELKRLLREFPVTSVYVTHDQTEAVALGDRIAVMRFGQIEQTGTYQQLYRNPKNSFVATFVGTPPINLFNGFAIDGQWRGDNFGGYPIRADLESGTRVKLGVRPEHIQLAQTGVPFRVVAVTPYFAERHQLIEAHGNGETWLLSAPLEPEIAAGEKLHCQLDPEGILYFDSQTGVRIG